MGVASDGATRWAVILAGGDGARLRSLTERISGDGRPKQFCPVLGSETRALAHTLRARGALWNTFVMAARVATLIRAIRDTVPALYQAFGRVRPLLHTGREGDAIGALYRELAPVDFSREVLAAPRVPLAVLPVRSVWWNDLGTPDRVLATERRVAAVGVTSGAA